MGEFQRAVRAGRVTMQSFNHLWLRSYADLAPDVPVGLLFGTRPTEVDLTLAAQWADQVNPALGVMQESDVARIHQLPIAPPAPGSSRNMIRKTLGRSR